MGTPAHPLLNLGRGGSSRIGRCSNHAGWRGPASAPTTRGQPPHPRHQCRTCASVAAATLRGQPPHPCHQCRTSTSVAAATLATATAATVTAGTTGAKRRPPMRGQPPHRPLPPRRALRPARGGWQPARGSGYRPHRRTPRQPPTRGGVLVTLLLLQPTAVNADPTSGGSAAAAARGSGCRPQPPRRPLPSAPRPCTRLARHR